MEKVELKLNKEIFGIEPNEKVMYDAVITARNGMRQGTYKVKTRSEVSGGGRKPWRQKGTGRARQGSIRAPQWVGGGIALGPVPRDYSQKMNRKERKLALKSVLSEKAKAKEIIVIDNFDLASNKTKDMLEALKKFKLEDKKVLLVMEELTENVILAGRNLQNVLMMEPVEINVLDLVNADTLLVTEKAVKEIEEALK
ncbi:MAG: 50S ribosomal protein L4 [archaeon]|nr:50S ribosomal protein L4 [archaeon]